MRFRERRTEQYDPAGDLLNLQIRLVLEFDEQFRRGDLDEDELQRVAQAVAVGIQARQLYAFDSRYRGTLTSAYIEEAEQQIRARIASELQHYRAWEDRMPKGYKIASIAASP